MSFAGSAIERAMSAFDQATFQQSFEALGEGLDELEKNVPKRDKVAKEKLMCAVLRTAFVSAEPIALISVGLASLKNTDYLQDWNACFTPAVLTSRAYYVEAAFTSIVGCIHNLVMTLFFAICTAVTLGQHDESFFKAKMYLLVTGASIASLGISVVGTVSPMLGHEAFQSFVSCIVSNGAGMIRFLNPPIPSSIQQSGSAN